MSDALNLPEELKAYLDSDPPAAAALPGAVYNGDAPRSADLPYASFLVTESARRNSIKPGYAIDQVTVTFHVRATDSSQATRLAGLLKGRLLPTPDHTPPPFTGRYGRECGRFSNGPDQLQLDPDRAPYGSDCWCYSFPVVWTLARG